MPHTEAYLARHADKGEWFFNEEEARAKLPSDKATLIKTILEEKELLDQTLPLKLEGLERSLGAGDELFKRLPERCILVTLDSKKPRADLTEAIITARIGQLEAKSAAEDQHAGKKRIDMLHIEEDELSALLQDENTDTWDKFSEMMKTEGISESAAIARQVNQTDQRDATLPESAKETLSDSAGRYREAIRQIRNRITSEQIPVAILGIGHSGPLSVIQHQELGRNLEETDIPQFCQMFVFDKQGNLTERQNISL